VAGTLVLPLALMHSRALAEIVIGAVDVLFLTHATLRHDWTWTGAPWLIATALWCGWVMVCAPFGVSGWPTLAQATLAQATLALRLPLFAAALGTWVLTRPDDRRWLHWVVTAAAAWIALECWQQYLLGTNLFGQPRWGDGALTGPFNQPRAGSALFFVLLPALVPAAIALLARRAALARMAGVILPVAGVATMVLIGQRMPTLLTLLALVASGLLLRRLRIAVAATLGAAALLVAATPVISPATFHKLVVRFAEQMAHFPSSNYGLLYIRATVIALAHPWLGIGYDGFRAGCPDPAYARGLPALGVPDSASGGIDACNIHPHNFYLEAAVNAGVPGLVLFAVAATAMLITLGRHLAGQPIRVALFATMLGALWPLASTNDFYSVPNAGWLMLLLGWGLAERSRA
jgi:O-antigen ligase